MSKVEIELSAPCLGENEQRYLEECLRENALSVGRHLQLFEERVAALLGAPYAVAASNGTSALHLALLASGLEPGDEVLVPTLTFIAPVNAIAYCGAHPVFMDCDEWLRMDVEKVRLFLETHAEAKGSRTRNRRTGRRIFGVLPVHLFGNPVDMDPLLEVTRRYGLKVIEDSAESLGSRYKGRMAGNLGDAGCVSFNGNKIVTAAGGGMVVTRDEQLARRARYLANQAKDDALAGVHHAVGYNYRLSNLHAALGLAQLERLEKHIELKRRNYLRYREMVSGVPGLELLGIPPHAEPNYWFYTLFLDAALYGEDRDALMRRFLDAGVEVRPTWQLNHLQRPYREAQVFRIERAPELQPKALHLPCSVSLSPEQMERVVSLLKARSPALQGKG